MKPLASPSLPAALEDAHRAYVGTRYFASLDGLRCISILAVIGHHANVTGTHLLERGWLGVQLFFVISGYLITTLLLREKERTGGVSLSGFYARRSLRIFPLYYAVLALYVALVLATERHSPAGEAFLANLPSFLTYTSNWFVPPAESPGVRVIFVFAWSLATEEQFYLFWPLVVRSARRATTPLWFISGLMLADLGLEALAAAGMLPLGPVATRAVTSVATTICMGCILAYALHSPRTFRWAYAVLGRAWSFPVALLATAALYLLPGAPDALVEVAMVALIGAACIRPTHAWQGALRWRPVVHVGMVSYGVYMLHMLCINAVRRLPLGDGLLAYAVAVALSVGVATLSFRFFEQPFLRLKERLGRTAETPGGGTAPAVVPPAA
jgi:peptidoglycan/LPS O-acetylase OafA/YrhL